jgi:hypothetical protein
MDCSGSSNANGTGLSRRPNAHAVATDRTIHDARARSSIDFAFLVMSLVQYSTCLHVEILHELARLTCAILLLVVDTYSTLASRPSGYPTVGIDAVAARPSLS